MGTRWDRLTEAVLTCTHNLCFEQKYENTHKISTENCHFYSCEILQYIAWTCFRNGTGLVLQEELENVQFKTLIKELKEVHVLP